ncbi:MAG TPA: VOC family protein [Chitinophagaceae bacterium]|nr:VOC family protein [Chitinophagaceae bacterium]
MAALQKITPHLWFNNEAEEAVNFYTSVFKNSAISRKSYYGKEGSGIFRIPEGTIMTIDFTLENQQFIALNGGPLFKFNESISFMVHCDTQEEIDYYWSRLAEGGDEKAQACGWLKDKFGLSWQIIPSILPELIGSSTPSKSQNVMKIFLQMKKPDIRILQDAYNNG